MLERGNKKVAEELLTQLHREVPDYLPAVLELALLHSRQGERQHAASLMREVVRRTDGLPGDQMVAGPAELSVSYYRTTADAFLTAKGGR